VGQYQSNRSSEKIIDICQFLEWDSNFFGYRIARIIPNKLDPLSIKAVLKWCKTYRIDCLYFLADSNDDPSIWIAEEKKFHSVDIRVTFIRELNEIWIQPGMDFSKSIRPFHQEDIDTLRNIARLSYHDTRFYYDTRFPVHLVDAFYETWIEKSCKGSADQVFVFDMGGKAAGYISCQLLDAATGQIGLVGVNSNWRGKGIGQALVMQALKWFADQGLTKVSVVTQGRNIGALKLYENCGFQTSCLQIWYHRWFC
jgi:dTDP-4-amino-4,6-dideoxy-D-galactose acyltransferase